MGKLLRESWLKINSIFLLFLLLFLLEFCFIENFLLVLFIREYFIGFFWLFLVVKYNRLLICSRFFGIVVLYGRLIKVGGEFVLLIILIIIWVREFLFVVEVRIESINFFFLLVGFRGFFVEIILEFVWIVNIVLVFLIEYVIGFLFRLMVWMVVIKVFVGVFFGILV